MSPTFVLSTTAAILMLASHAIAADFDAQAYHGANCTRCHDTGVYTREDRKMRSYSMLNSRVAGCDARFGEKLPAEGLAELVDYLNDSYYRFKR